MGAVAFLLVVGLAVTDVILGPELSFSLFYVLPLGGAAWYVGRGWGIFLSVLGGGLWLGVDFLLGGQYERGWVPVWNSAARIGMFLVVVLLLDRLRNALDRERLLASVDSLTGLANSRSFFDQLEEEVNRGARYGDAFTVAYFDLDGFKSVNDRAGHAEGDRILKAVAEALRTSSRRTDIPARLGGDEFGVLLPRTSYQDGGTAVRKLLDQVQARLEAEGWPMTASVGVVTFEADWPAPQQAIQMADTLMYQVKDGGKGGIRHSRWEDLRRPPQEAESPTGERKWTETRNDDDVH